MILIGAMTPVPTACKWVSQGAKGLMEDFRVFANLKYWFRGW